MALYTNYRPFQYYTEIIIAGCSGYFKGRIIKIFVPVLLLIIYIAPADAQSKNTLIYGNALVRDKNMQTTGTVIIAVGAATLFTGNLLYRKTYNDRGNSEPPEDKVNTYRYVMFGGLGLMAVGIPVWAIGKSKERHIKIEAQLIKFKGLASANGIGLKIKF